MLRLSRITTSGRQPHSCGEGSPASDLGRPEAGVAGSVHLQSLLPRSVGTRGPSPNPFPEPDQKSDPGLRAKSDQGADCLQGEPILHFVFLKLRSN